MSWIDKLVDAATLGKAADYTQDRTEFEDGKGPEPVLNADDLRRLILGLRSPSDPVDFQPAMAFHWEIKSLRINGRLDLRDGRLPSGSPLPALEFTGCIFEDGICADGAHLERLHLSRCKFGTVDAAKPQLSLKSVRIENELRLSRLQPLLEAGYLCVDASSAYIGANLIIKRLELRALPHQRMDYPLRTAFALNLRNANVRADVLLEPELTVHGGIMAVGIHIGGDLRAIGLIANDGEDGLFRKEVRADNSSPRNALALDSARVAGNLYLVTKDDQRVSRLTGEVSMQGIHVEGALGFWGICFDSGSENNRALNLLGGVVKGGIYAVEGTTKQGTTIQTSFSDAVVVSRCSIIGGLTFQCSFPTFYADGFSVQGDVVLDSTLSVRRSPDGSTNEEEGTNAYATFGLTGSTITGSLRVASSYSNTRWAPVSPEGQLCLEAAFVGSDLTVTGYYDSIYAKRLTVTGNAYLQAIIIHYVELSKSDLRGDLDLSRFKFYSRDPLMNKTPLATPRFFLADADIKRALKLGTPLSQDNEIVFSRARYCTPLCYPQLQVVEIGATKRDKDVPAGTTFWTTFLLYPGRAVINLDGRSFPIHLVNGAGGFLRLRTPQQQMDYLRFFCAYVWGELGPFRIIESSDNLPPLVEGQSLPDLKTIEVTKNADKSHVILTEAHVRYGGHLFKAKFEIFQEKVKATIKGMIQMTEDEPLCEFQKKDGGVYHPPLSSRAATEPDTSAYAADWMDIKDENLLNKKIPNWRVPFRQRTVTFENALINLTDASCGTLEDADGVAWGPEVTLQLENFTYLRITATAESSDEMIAWPWKRGSLLAGKLWTASHRITSALRPLHRLSRRWLGFPQEPLPDFQLELGSAVPRWFSNLQKSGLRRTGVRERLQWLEQRREVQPSSVGEKRFEPFLQQPYTQLAKVFRDQGDESEARKVEAERIRIDRWLRAKQSFAGKLALLIFGPYRFFFLYGLSPIRALSTFIFCLALGWAATAFINKPGGLLVQSTSTVATAISLNGDPATPIVPYQAITGKAAFDCDTAISEPLYAIDVFIPLLDLRQEGRCDIRSTTKKDLTPVAAFRTAKGTRGAILRGFAKAIKATLGYPSVWQWLKSIYAVVGWIVTSLTILTFSGTLRKWDQGK